jgi:hypothetical protein
LTYIYLSSTQQAYMEERAEVLREDVRKILIGSTELPETLNLILTLQRLGLDYYYEDDIDKLLHRIYNSDYSDKDLNLVSLRFYLLRKNGYDVSSGKIRSCTRNCVFFSRVPWQSPIINGVRTNNVRSNVLLVKNRT